MASAADTIRTRIIAAIQSASVASFAGVVAATWASTTAPHVFDAENALIAGRNRGRLPFVEVQIETQEFDSDGSGCGTMRTRVKIRVHTGGYQKLTARQKAEAIATSSFAAIVASNAPYFDDGEVRTSIDAEDTPAPGWNTLDASLTVEHSYDPTTFEAT
jgi:hypothetical protein